MTRFIDVPTMSRLIETVGLQEFIGNSPILFAMIS